MNTIRVLAADDSAVMRSLLTRMFAGSGQGHGQARLELCATVADGEACLRAVETLQPDVVLMDFEMPGMGGLKTLDALRRGWPRLPVIMCSTYTEDGAAATLEALSRGAAEYVTKPAGKCDPGAAIASLWTQLAPKIHALANRSQREVPKQAARPLHTLFPAFFPAPVQTNGRAAAESGEIDLIAIGVSTGGPAALERLLPGLPSDFATPIVIVQHMPKLFTDALAKRLDRSCALRVELAVDGASLTPGNVWLAPGDSHIEVRRTAFGSAKILLHQGQPVNHCRPAVDVLFHSVALAFGKHALGIVLTGMGSDGLDGARAIVNAGGMVLAQDEASSAVWGMPGRIVEEGLARATLSLEQMATEMISLAPGRLRSEAA